MPDAKRHKTAGSPPRRPPEPAPHSVEIAVAGLAHDIRTPLTGIMALSELLLASDLPEQQREWALAIKGAGEHLAQLTTLVVEAAKAGDAGEALRLEPFSPRVLVDAAAASLKARVAGKGLAVRVSVARALPASVVGDVVRLRSALENLIDNAVKFTEHGQIRLSVSAAPAPRGQLRLAFVITDSGVGILAADQARLFQPFAQASNQASAQASTEVARRYGGAGLGLLLVKRAAQAMGGDVTVSSRLGRGSTFKLTVMVESTPPVAITRRPVRGAKPRGLRLLCVDDNPYGRVVLNAVLGELGHRVAFAASGEAAVAAVAEGDYDAVLMDVTLGGIDGFEATRRIRKLRAPRGRIPIVGVSGRSDGDDAARATAAGMNAYLRKPASPADLHAALAGISPRGAKRRR